MVGLDPNLSRVMQMVIGVQMLQMVVPCWTSYSLFCEIIKQIPSKIMSKPKNFWLMILSLVLITSSLIYFNFATLQYFPYVYLAIPFTVGCVFLILPSLMNMFVIGTPCQYIIKQIDDLHSKIINEKTILNIVSTYTEFQNIASKHLFTLFSSTTLALCLNLYTLMIQLTCLEPGVSFSLKIYNLKNLVVPKLLPSSFFI